MKRLFGALGILTTLLVGAKPSVKAIATVESSGKEVGRWVSADAGTPVYLPTPYRLQLGESKAVIFMETGYQEVAEIHDGPKQDLRVHWRPNTEVFLVTEHGAWIAHPALDGGWAVTK